jgi:hypothetical protein
VQAQATLERFGEPVLNSPPIYNDNSLFPPRASWPHYYYQAANAKAYVRSILYPVYFQAKDHSEINFGM